MIPEMWKSVWTVVTAQDPSVIKVAAASLSAASRSA